MAHTSLAPGCGLKDITGDDDSFDGSLPDVPRDSGGDGGSHDHPGTGVVCGLNFNSTDPSVIKGTWTNSDAGYWLGTFLSQAGASHWSDKFFSSVLNGGSQGGSTYDCDHIHTGNCPGPLSTPCTSYSPNQAFYVHVSIGWLYSAFEQIWAGLVTNGIDNLAEGIKDIVAAYGTPPKDDNALILNFLVGFLTSLAGISGTIGAKFPNAPVGQWFGTAANPLTFAAGIVTQVAANSDGLSNLVSPDDLEKEFEQAYGAMFRGIVGGLNSSVNSIFDGVAPKGYDGSNEDYVSDVFRDGRWLSKEIVDPLVESYIDNTQIKFVSAGGRTKFASMLLLTILAGRIRDSQGYEIRQQGQVPIALRECGFSVLHLPLLTEISWLTLILDSPNHPI